MAHLRGYQDFVVHPGERLLKPLCASLVAKDAAVARAFTPRFMARRTVLDLGGNNGYFAFRALAAGADSATVVDMDVDCILNLERVRSRFPDLPLEAHRETIESWNRPASVVVAFALVHWLFSCTQRALSMEAIVGALASLARDLLLVEWVDPSDAAVLGFHHTEVEQGAVAEDYAFGPFLSALSAHFPRVELLSELSPTRRIYLASRERLPDLSWSAPLLFPKETLLSSRCLWSTGEVEFWSRVYRLGGTVFRQCSAELAEREVVAERRLGTAVEVLDRRDDWWLLRTEYVDGETLDEAVARARPSPGEILKLTLKLLDRVAALERAGVVHRDLHPANIVQDRAGDLHFIDYGWAQVPGLPEISSEWLGKSIQLPATHTVLDVRPPEASGADLFAVGRIVAWMNLGSDPSIEFLARWLSHGDHRVRLRDVQLARHLAKRMLLAREGGSAPSPEGLEGRFLDELLRFAAASKDKATRLEERQVHLQRDLEALQAERPKLMAELEASRERSRELQESLQGARQAAAEAEARQREALASRARRRFRSAREFWSSVRRLLGRGRCE